MSDDLPTHLMVSAAQRTATEAGVGFYIRKRGEAGRGTLLVVVNDQAGTNRLCRQIWDGKGRTFVDMEAGEERDIEAAITREVEFDPDLWVIEIEDRQGRLFFDKIFLAADTI